MGKQSPARTERLEAQAMGARTAEAGAGEAGAIETRASGTGTPGSWQWGSTPKTRRALLEAARQVFTEQGYAQTSIADVVERAGSSVGSLYHHFGGKSELFLALWQERGQAGDVIDAVIEYARRLMADGRWKPDRALQEARA